MNILQKYFSLVAGHINNAEITVAGISAVRCILCVLISYTVAAQLHGYAYEYDILCLSPIYLLISPITVAR